MPMQSQLVYQLSLLVAELKLAYSREFWHSMKVHNELEEVGLASRG